MKISELLDGITKKDHVLPEFQREYVWTKDQAKQLMVSLVKEYPVGSLLFWKTDQPPELKNVDVRPDKLGSLQAILDGQQRLTALYMLMRGEIPPYYRTVDSAKDPRDLFFDLTTGDFQYYQSSRMKDNPLWVRVVDCFVPDKIDAVDIAEQAAKEPKQFAGLVKLCNKNLTRLRNSEKDDLPVQYVPAHAAMEDAIDIFDRVNSQGTKLTDADLALTHVTGKWAHARRVMKKKREEMKAVHFNFDLTFMTRALTGVVCQRALFETIHSRQEDELLAGWESLSKILDYLTAVLPRRASIHSTWDLNTSNVFVPLIVYLSLHSNKFPDETAAQHAIHWLYAAHTWSRYTSQVDQRLEHDISLVVREVSPWNALRNQIIDQRGRLDIKADDLDGRGIQHPVFRMAFILSKTLGAVDWFDGSPLGSVSGKKYAPNCAHIFPPKILYRNGYDSDNHMHRKVVNEIANRMVLNSSHLHRDQLPEEYFPMVEASYPGALVKQFIPMAPALWKLDRFDDFLAARRELVALKINEFMHGLTAKPETVHKRPLADLIKLGESATLEFKSTLQWDMVQEKQNSHLRLEVLKTIAAFLNSSGGTLVIGVEDDGNVCGLENDLRLTKRSTDGYQQTLAALLSQHIGPQFAPHISMRFEGLNDQQVCVLDIEKASAPAFISWKNDSLFFMRLASTSRSLDTEEAVKYINQNWG